MKSKFISILGKCTIVGLIVSAVSFFIKIVPCKILESPEAVTATKLSLCQLPNPFQNIQGLSTLYYGISNNPLTGLILQFLIPFAVFLLIFLLIRRRAGKVLDLTRK